MLEITGGCYLEHCIEPYWSQLFGSGLRAAAAVSERSNDVRLHTQISQDEQHNLEAIGKTFNVEVESKLIPRTLSFNYRHGLSTPRINQFARSNRSTEPFEINGDVILRFGMLDGDAVVRGNRVVYDPQSIQSPELFHENGSHAQQLAYVLNSREIIALTSEPTVESAVRCLIQDYEANVVIVKQGPFGALVCTAGIKNRIPVFRTSRVWPIGSGDVFAAIFAYSWGECKDTPIAAANLASLATAFYCHSKILPIPRDLESNLDFEPKPLQISFPEADASKPLVYLAGPFFTMAQRWMIDESRNALRSQGIRVFSPFHDVGHGIARDVVPADIRALDQSQMVFAIVDGLDSGTLFEIGYARARNIPVVAFVQSETTESLKMLEGTECNIQRDFVSAIYQTVWSIFSDE